MYAATIKFPGLAELATLQAGVLRRDQLAAAETSYGYAARQIAQQRWTAWGRNVVLLQNAPPTRRQLMWIAVLDAGQPSALSSHTSLEVVGFRGFGVETAAIHIVVPRGARYTNLAGVLVHESRRFSAADVTMRARLPRTSSARSAIDAAAWQPWPRYAAALLAAVVQQRLCTARQLHEALERAGKIRHRRHMKLALGDIAGGAESLGEIDVAALCRRHGLAPPTRQSLRRESSGRVRYPDCEWELPDGSSVVLEIDGSHHLDAEHWEADIKRERAIVIEGSRVLRATVNELRLEAAAVAGDLKAIGVPSLRPVRTQS